MDMMIIRAETIKKLFMIAGLLAAFASFGKAQCVAPAGYVCITQETANRLNKALDELGATKALVETLNTRITGLEKTTAEATKLANDLQAIVTHDEKMFAVYDRALALYDRVFTLYEKLVTSLEAKISKPKSAWDKFLSALKKVADIALGVAIGRVTR